MGLVVGLPNLIEAHLGVALGGAELPVAKQLLHGAQVRACSQKVRGEGVAQDVGGDGPGEACSPAELL